MHSYGEVRIHACSFDETSLHYQGKLLAIEEI